MLFTSLFLAAAADVSVLTIGQVSQPAAAGPYYFQVSGGDLDGDGAADDGIVRITCENGAVVSAHQVIAPRDSASGMASGKRMHKPLTVIKEWGAATPELAAIKPTYDVKTIKGARVAADAEGWSPIALENTTGLCEASRRAVKTRSNIQNN